jgi:hypothetical protein
MNNFEDGPRRQQEIRCRPTADKIYKEYFGDNINIIRGEDLILDKYFAIDVRIILGNGMNLLGQEKFLSAEYAKYGTVTVEYYQNQFTKEQGDWFKLGVQIYLVGYEHSSGFLPYVLLDWTKVSILSNNNVIRWNHNSNKNGKAKASFAYVKMNDIPKECILASKLANIG